MTTPPEDVMSTVNSSMLDLETLTSTSAPAPTRHPQPPSGVPPLDVHAALSHTTTAAFRTRSARLHGVQTCRRCETRERRDLENTVHSTRTEDHGRRLYRQHQQELRDEEQRRERERVREERLQTRRAVQTYAQRRWRDLWDEGKRMDAKIAAYAQKLADTRKANEAQRIAALHAEEAAVDEERHVHARRLARGTGDPHRIIVSRRERLESVQRRRRQLKAVRERELAADHKALRKLRSARDARMSALRARVREEVGSALAEVDARARAQEAQIAEERRRERQGLRTRLARDVPQTIRAQHQRSQRSAGYGRKMTRIARMLYADSVVWNQFVADAASSS